MSGTTRRVQRVRALDAQTAFLLMDDGSLRRTADAGANWSVATSSFSSQIRDVLASDALTIIGVGLNGIIRRATDGGATFTTIASDTTGDVNSIARAPGAPGTLYAGGFFDMLKSTDGGLTWQSQKTTLPTFEAGFVWDLAAVSATVVWGTSIGNPAILKTTTGGE